MLGKGGMGEVYEAYDTGKDRVVALKLLAPELAQDPAYQVRFRRESQAAAKLAEPHVIPIHDWGVIDGVLFIDMRLVPGTDLRTVLRAGGPLSPDRAVAVVEQIAAALDAAHAGGLVHRDVKPANILVTPADFAYLADFGIAHTEGDSAVTQAGMAMGSYIYMAPERFDVGPISGRADVYSLACVLHECLTGAAPFPAASMSVLIRAHLSEAPPKPSTLLPGLPPSLDEVIAIGMAKDPADRYASAGELAVAAREALVAAIQDGLPVGGPQGAGAMGVPSPGTGAAAGAAAFGAAGAGARNPVPGKAPEGWNLPGGVGTGGHPVAGGRPVAGGGRGGQGGTGGHPMPGGAGGRGATGGHPVPGGQGGPGGGGTGGRVVPGGADAGQAVPAGGVSGSHEVLGGRKPGGADAGGRTVSGGRKAHGEGRGTAGSDDDNADAVPTPTGEFRVVGAVTATGGIETSRSQTQATGAQPTLIIRPPANPETAGFQRVPAEGTGEVSIPAVIQPTGPAEIRPDDTYFTPLPPADAPVAPEPPPAYTPDQGLPKMRPFPDAHLYEGAQPGETSAPVPHTPYPAPAGFADATPSGPVPQRAAPTQRYAGPPPEYVDTGRSNPNPRFAPTADAARPPLDATAAGGPAAGSPFGPPDPVRPPLDGASGPVPQRSAPTQRYQGDPQGAATFDGNPEAPLGSATGAPNPDSDNRFGAASVPNGPLGSDTDAPTPFSDNRFGAASAPGSPFGSDPGAPGAAPGGPFGAGPEGHSGPLPHRSAPTQRYSGDPRVEEYVDSGRSNPNPRFGPGGPESGSPAGGFGDDESPFGEGGAPDPRFRAPDSSSDARFAAPAGGFGGEDSPHRFGPTEKFGGDDDRFGSAPDGFDDDRTAQPARFASGPDRFDDDHDGADRPGPDARFGAPAGGFGDPNRFGAPTEQYRGVPGQGEDPRRVAATRQYGGVEGPATEQYDPAAFDAQRSAPTQHYQGASPSGEPFGAPDPQRAQATQQYRGGAAPFPAHQAPSDDPYGGQEAYAQYDENNAYGDHAYRDPAYGADPYGPDPGYAEPAWQQRDSGRNKALLPILVGVLTVAVLVIGGAIGWRLMSGGDSATDTAAAPSSAAPIGGGGAATTAPRATTAAPTTSAGPVTLPAGAQPCESGSTGGAFGKAAIGSTVTSCGFAEAVRAAYASGGSAAGPRSVVATSPVTGRTYTMDCTPAGKLVTCTGGENAVVYVY
ncbi:serine/threonine-protein kinase [Nocardia neocaledoniensis]|uniref:serine/threonine-protein kinase n=1 Tax=Nocardia neocaledoniensis TaxID=236511 RepID=UPI002458B49A|nr:serine/threonine-protein kinase [Nocardia neocaledoniensis]